MKLLKLFLFVILGGPIIIGVIFYVIAGTGFICWAIADISKSRIITLTSLSIISLVLFCLISIITFKVHKERSIIAKILFSIAALTTIATFIAMHYLPYDITYLGSGNDLLVIPASITVCIYIPILQVYIKNLYPSKAILIHLSSPYVLGIILLILMSYTIIYLSTVNMNKPVNTQLIRSSLRSSSPPNIGK